MGNITNLQKQHGEIIGVIANIENMINKGELENTAKNIAYGINNLAGKLKMHLLSEDQHLYPQLINSGNAVLSTTAQNFNKEMGQLAGVFAKFVQDYNIPAKILKEGEKFKAESKKIFDVVRNRVHKEETKLYPLLEG